MLGMKLRPLLWKVLGLLLLLLLLDVSHQQLQDDQVWIVYLGAGPSPLSVEGKVAGQQRFLASFLGSQERAASSVVHHYKYGFNGFAAKLSAAEVAEMSGRPEVAAVMPNTRRVLHTTRSWDYLGLGPWQAGADLVDTGSLVHGQDGSDVIVGVLDTGVWPESASFSDHGLPPVPSRWNGTCEVGPGFNSSSCNKKLIGARFFVAGYEAMNPPPDADGSDYRSPRDSSGHGTHTASTAVGAPVASANVFGVANGTARGGSPFSRLAVYKVCWAKGCYDVDILAAFDFAIRDGVDVLSVSMGAETGGDADFFSPLSLGAFHSVQNGITVVASAGNEGPQRGTVSNASPWILTVGANSMDRGLSTDLLLGDGQTVKGVSFNSMDLARIFHPLVSGSDIHGELFTPFQSSHCSGYSLDPAKAKGKIVVCLHSDETGDDPRGVAAQEVLRAGGIGVVFVDDIYAAIAGIYVIPGTAVTPEQGAAIFTYINKAGASAMAKILPSQTVFGIPSPVLGTFSSRGPSSLSPDLIKPDITAPGVDILAAWSGAVAPSTVPGDVLRSRFNILTGTSMACPHAAGVAALVKAVHPSWSPSAIKSAIVTTAASLNGTGNAMDWGAGQISPGRALMPGLVYNASDADYLAFLCSSGVPIDKLSLLLGAGANFSCPSPSQALPPRDLNYPSIAVSSLGRNGTVTVHRRVTNVGPPQSTYVADVTPPPGVLVSVVPSTLRFSVAKASLTFEVTFQANPGANVTQGYLFGWLTWRDGVHVVCSPIAVAVT